MTDAPMQPRGSFRETSRLFASGAPWLLLLTGLVMGIFFPLVPRTPTHLFLSMGIVCGVWFMFVTMALELSISDRLAFITLVPQPVEPKWFVLAPMSVLAVATAAASLFGHLPAAAAVSWLGCMLWTIGATRWVGRLSWWASLIALPVPAAAAFAAWQAYRVAGWWASGAVAMAFALVALALQPRACVTDGSSRTEGSPRRRATEAASGRQAASRGAAGRWPWLASALRYERLTAQSSTLGVIGYCVVAASAVSSPVFGMGLAFYMMSLFIGGTWNVYSDESAEFLRTRPFSKGQLLVAGTFRPLLLVLVLPVVALPLINLDLINAGGVLGWMKNPSSVHQSTIDFLREVLGATYLPEKWPTGGLTLDLWLRVRPLLYWDLLRCALLAVAFQFAMAPLRASRAGRVGGTWLGLAIYALAVRNTFGAHFPLFKYLPIVPLWLAPLLAAAAFAHWSWRARVVNAPARAMMVPPRGTK